jgi:hypothetical protein
VKKLIAMFALCAFLVAGVVGCGGGATTKKTETKTEEKKKTDS